MDYIGYSKRGTNSKLLCHCLIWHLISGQLAVIFREKMEAYRHDPFQETGVWFWGNLPLKGPLLHNGGNLRIVHV